MKLKVMPIVGTRPEAVKLAPIICEMQRRPDQFDVVVTLSAQHRQLLDQILTLFDIHAAYDLNVMQPGQTIYEITSKVLLGLGPILAAERPDLVLVQGDTTTVMAGALAAFYAKIAVGHVEAGLRTYDKYQPFPEEINRRLVTHLADWHFVPTAGARENLLREGVRAEQIFLTGNTVVDALLATVQRAVDFTHPVLRQLDFEQHRVILVTTHRRENWGEPIRNICRAIRLLVQRYPNLTFVYAVHPNPTVQEVVRAEIGGLDRVHLLDAVAYEEFVHLMGKSHVILTDSGGIQEEAPSLHVPVLVLRNVTERPEGLAAGALKLVGTDTRTIFEEVQRLLDDADAYRQMTLAGNPYGDGRAAQRIVDILATLTPAPVMLPVEPQPVEPQPVAPVSVAPAPVVPIPAANALS